MKRPVPLDTIRLLVLDVDGVMTDGRLAYGPDGEIGKTFHVRDGYGIKAARAAGIEVAVVSGRDSAAVQVRCRELGILHACLGVEHKGEALAALLALLKLEPRQCACVGDDAPDLPLLRQAGLAVAVADAHPVALAAAHRRTRQAGGAGAVREVCDWLLAAKAAETARAARRRARGRR